LSSIVLLFATIIPLAALGEPPLTASDEEARAYLVKVSVGWPQTVIALSSVAAIGILWFVVGLTLVLRRAEGDPQWRSTIALVSGVLLTAYKPWTRAWTLRPLAVLILIPLSASGSFAGHRHRRTRCHTRPPRHKHRSIRAGWCVAAAFTG
jgi:hypothetical protein